MWSGSPRAQIVVQRPDVQNLGAGPPPPLFAPRQPSSASNVVLSPAVVAYWQTHDNGDGTGSLDLLILWRGTPGWFLRGDGSSGGGVGGGGFGHWTISHTMTYGDVSVSFDLISSSPDFDPATTVAQILGSEIGLRDTNVVLIDGVDSGPPTIVATQHVDPAFTGRDPVAVIVKRSPELFEFLRCDITLPDPNQQAIMSFLCGRVRP
jgi:hypothetical protein